MDNNDKMIEETENFSPKFNEATGFMGKIRKGVHGATSGFETVFLSIILVAGIAISFSGIPGKLDDIMNGGNVALLRFVNFVAVVVIAIKKFLVKKDC